MNRREFISSTGATLLGTAIGSERLFGDEPKLAAGSGISWHRHEGSKLFDRVAVNGQPLLNPEEGAGLFDGWARLVEGGQLGAQTVLNCRKPKGKCGLVQLSLAHGLRRSTGNSKEDLLEASLTLQNRSERPCEVLVGFLTGARPCRNIADQQVYVPLASTANLMIIVGKPQASVVITRMNEASAG